MGKEVIPALTDLSNDPAFSTRLTQAGGLISLLGIGLELYSKMREDSQTDEQMAFKSLYTIVFASSEALLIEISEKYLGGSDIGIDISKRKELMDNLFDAFKESSDDDFSHVEDLPAVKQFKTIIIKQLKDKYPEKKTIIDYFGLKFGTELDFKARTDDNIRKFYDWSATQEQYTLLKKYLERLVQKTEKEDVVSFTEKPLRERYIEHRLVCSDADTWLWSDREILNTTQQDIVYMDTLLKDFLSVPPSDKRYLIVGASFGIGKTWLVKRIASQSASNYINQADLTGSENGSYRPILVFLKHGLTVAYSEDDVDTILQEIVAPQDDKNPEVSSRKILLILDGLDEYRQDKEKLVNEKIRGEYRKRYPKMKVIITTRLQPKIRDLLHIEYDEYIRLLPFNSDQVDKVFKNYRVKLNYEGALQLGLHDDEITKPLFAWMFSSMFADTELKIEFKKDWTNNMRKTLIYMLFFHYIITGRYKSAFRKDAWNQLYTYEKKALRKIAALKMIYRDALQEDIIKNALEKFGPPTDVSNSADYVESILSSYCYLRFIKGKPSIEFIHESLKDYLLSEYYIESLLEEQMHRLNVGTPSEETILFLDGLVELLNSKDDSIKKFVANNEINLLMSFNYKEDLDDARNKLIDVASRCLNDENIIVCNVNYDIKEKFWTTIETTNNDYINFWIHKWISLYILNKLDPKKIIKENLINLIHASNMIPGHVKSLKNIDLSHDSHGSAIFVNLERTILTEAAMYDVNLELADLAGADLSHAQLELVNLTNADLRSTKLHSTRFVNSNLNGAKLSNATIIRAFLLNTDLCFVNMNSANLSLSVIIGCTKYDGLLCDKADFSSAIIDNKMLVDYLVENHASNVPASITDRSELKNKLVSIGESQNEINKLLEFSILPPMD